MANKIYIISDSHFGHSKMEEWSLRPADFNERIWKGIEALPADAILIHLGDVTMGADHETAHRLVKLPFKKWLVRGNHDNHSITWYVANGWDAVCDEMVLNIFGSRILLSHMPLPKREGILKNVHGHLHGGKSRERPDFYDEAYHVEVCPEVVGYQPVKLGNV
jgi:calcineurin-like phosphoesterase family protein